jgi:clan AA aspartic protease (TIGR02281 family)
LLLVLPGPLAAEIYRWQDEKGHWNFAQDLNQVPPAYRAAAKAGTRREGEGPEIQRFRPAPPAAVPSRTPRQGMRSSGSASASGGPVHRIRVQRAGSSMRVRVRLNDAIDAPFILDTGASDVSIPYWVAQELGIDLDAARTQLYQTANGIVESPVVNLSSVELGSARVENVPASVSRSMQVGLLGLSFFNHFRYDFDPAAGIVTLRPNGMAEAGRLRGGRSESQWRGEFATLSARRRAIEAALDEVGPGRARREARLEQAIEEIDRQLQVLEGEADDARVPMAWRQ